MAEQYAHTTFPQALKIISVLKIFISIPCYGNLPAVVPPDQEREVVVALLAHCHPLVRDPDGGALAEGADGDLKLQ